MLAVMAFALYLFAISEVREGRLGAALVLGVLAVVMSGVAAAVGA